MASSPGGQRAVLHRAAFPAGMVRWVPPGAQPSSAESASTRRWWLRCRCRAREPAPRLRAGAIGRRRGTDPVDDRRSGPTAGRRADVLAVLRKSPSPMGVAEIAKRLGVHLNTVRFHLDHLVSAGQVERSPVTPTGRGRPQLAFRARPVMDLAGPRNYRLLAEIMVCGLAGAPDAVARMTDAGRDWGRRLVDKSASTDRPVDRLVDLLDDLGFAPEQRPAEVERQIGLRHCPFLDLVQTRGTSSVRRTWA